METKFYDCVTMEIITITIIKIRLDRLSHYYFHGDFDVSLGSLVVLVVLGALVTGPFGRLTHSRTIYHLASAMGP